jgi:hypothetical protein
MGYNVITGKKEQYPVEPVKPMEAPPITLREKINEYKTVMNKHNRENVIMSNKGTRPFTAPVDVNQPWYPRKSQQQFVLEDESTPSDAHHHSATSHINSQSSNESDDSLSYNFSIQRSIIQNQSNSNGTISMPQNAKQNARNDKCDGNNSTRSSQILYEPTIAIDSQPISSRYPNLSAPLMQNVVEFPSSVRASSLPTSIPVQEDSCNRYPASAAATNAATGSNQYDGMYNVARESKDSNMHKGRSNGAFQTVHPAVTMKTPRTPASLVSTSCSNSLSTSRPHPPTFTYHARPLTSHERLLHFHAHSPSVSHIASNNHRSAANEMNANRAVTAENDKLNPPSQGFVLTSSFGFANSSSFNNDIGGSNPPISQYFNTSRRN